jgi:hypothetical protein
MKLVRFGPAGAEKPGRVDSAGTIRDLSAHVADITGETLSPATMLHPATLSGRRAITPLGWKTLSGYPK